MKKSVATPSKAYSQAMEGWRLIIDLLGGTRTMRNAGERWLPRFNKEPEPSYVARLNKSILYNGLKDTINKISARPFAQPITTDQTLIEDVDRMGNDIDGFAAMVLKSGIKYGRSHILCEYVGGGMTLADDGEPYFSLLEAPDLIDWQQEMVKGKPKLVSVTVKESEKMIRVITETEWVIHEYNEKDWVVTDSGTHTFGEVPIITLQISDGFMSAVPPFEDLAWLNLAHWQSASDHTNILSFARVPMLFRTGFSKKELDEQMAIGPSVIHQSVNPDAKVGYVEPSGKAIEAGLNDLIRIERQMEALGMQPLMASVERTAKEVMIDNDRSMSDAQKWAKALQNALIEAYKAYGKWRNIELSPEVSVFMDFNLSSGDADILIRSAAAGLISRELYLREIQRRGVISDMTDIEDELSKSETPE